MKSNISGLGDFPAPVTSKRPKFNALLCISSYAPKFFQYVCLVSLCLDIAKGVVKYWSLWTRNYTITWFQCSRLYTIFNWDSMAVPQPTRNQDYLARSWASIRIRKIFQKALKFRSGRKLKHPLQKMHTWKNGNSLVYLENKNWSLVLKLNVYIYS